MFNVLLITKEFVFLINNACSMFVVFRGVCDLTIKGLNEILCSNTNVNAALNKNMMNTKRISIY